MGLFATQSLLNAKKLQLHFCRPTQRQPSSMLRGAMWRPAGQTDRQTDTAEARLDRGEIKEGRHNEMLGDAGVVMTTCWHCTVSLQLPNGLRAPTPDSVPAWNLWTGFLLPSFSSEYFLILSLSLTLKSCLSMYNLTFTRAKGTEWLKQFFRDLASRSNKGRDSNSQNQIALKTFV